MRRFARRGAARKSVRDTLADNLATFRATMPALPADDPRMVRFNAQVADRETHIARLGPKRHRSAPRGTTDKPLERTVLQNVITALKSDPRVAKVERNTAGSFMEGDRWVNVGVKGKLDLTVFLRSGRYMEIEVKRPGGKPKPHQQRRIDTIRAEGGLAGYCWSAESALALLP